MIMGITGVRSPWSSRADTATHQEPEPHPTDNEGEGQFSPLPPLEETEEPQAAADTASSNTAGSGEDLGRGTPEYLRQFEELFGRRVFGPNVPGASMGIVGPGDE
jgi:hypothetical protein